MSAPHALLASLEHRGAIAGTGGVFHHPPTGVIVAADARLDGSHAAAPAAGGSQPVDAATVIGRAYLEDGDRALDRLLGDFAVVLVDPRTDRVLLARDVYGMRPLYHLVVGRELLVASEVAQLLAASGRAPDPDEEMVARFLVGRFDGLHRSYHRGIAQVPPGAILELRGRRLRSRPLWRPDPSARLRLGSSAAYAEVLRATLEQAVLDRVDVDADVGVMLSGGVDSGVVAGTAGWLIEQGRAGARLHTYSYDFGRHVEADERHLSRVIVDRYATVHHDVPVEDAGPFAGFPANGPDMDDPLVGAFQLSFERTAAQARADGVARLFSGFRGDHVAGAVGTTYRTLLRRDGVSALVRELRSHRDATGAAVASLAWQRWLRPELGAVRRRATGRSPRVDRATPDPAGIPDWVSPALQARAGLDGDPDHPEGAAATALSSPFRTERLRRSLDPFGVRWTTANQRRFSRHGLEYADAWSDRRVLELSLALPQQALNPPGGQGKDLVRDSMRGVLPERARLGARKILPVPLADASLRSQGAPAVRSLFDQDCRSAAAGWVDPGRVLQEFVRFERGGELPDAFWWTVSLEWWLRTLDG